MGTYAATHGGHDAEWLLQNERVLNDHIAQQARKGRKPVMSKSPIRDVGPVPTSRADELQAAARFVRRKVDSDAIGEVLAMLGLEAL
jgi:hypothetical protein